MAGCGGQDRNATTESALVSVAVNHRGECTMTVGARNYLVEEDQDELLLALTDFSTRSSAVAFVALSKVDEGCFERALSIVKSAGVARVGYAEGQGYRQNPQGEQR